MDGAETITCDKYTDDRFTCEMESQMREFLVRARRAPTDPGRFLKSVGREPHVEYLAQIVLNGLFVSQDHRDDTVIHLALEGSSDFPKLVTLNGSTLGSLAGLHETALLKTLARALSAGTDLGKEETCNVDQGISITAISFEHFLKKRTDLPIYVLHRKGQDVRKVKLQADSMFIMTDHIPMPKKSFNTLNRLGVERICLGPTLLHASQCVTLLHNELDRQLFAGGD